MQHAAAPAHAGPVVWQADPLALASTPQQLLVPVSDGAVHLAPAGPDDASRAGWLAQATQSHVAEHSLQHTALNQHVNVQCTANLQKFGIIAADCLQVLLAAKETKIFTDQSNWDDSPACFFIDMQLDLPEMLPTSNAVSRRHSTQAVCSSN